MRRNLARFTGFFFGLTVQQRSCVTEDSVRFPNLIWAIGNRRLAHYELAQRAQSTPREFRAAWVGVYVFAPHERKRIAELLGFGEAWLFSEPVPTPLTESGSVETTSARTARDAEVEGSGFAGRWDTSDIMTKMTRSGKMPGCNLTESDLRTLGAWWITPKLAEQAMLRRVTSAEAATIVGRNGRGDYSGILFPYILPGRTVREYRLRGTTLTTNTTNMEG